MGKNYFLKRNWRLILSIITITALVVLVFAIHEQIVDTFRNLGRVNLWFLALLLPLTLIGYHAQTRMYQGLFKLLGNKIDYKFMFRVALELNFVNAVFPSGGVSGISYFGVRMRNAEITGTRASLVQVMKLLLLFASFEVLLIVGLLFMAIGGQANDVVILVSGSISTLLAVGTIGFLMVISSERRIHTTFSYITRVLNRIIHIFRPHKPETISTRRAEAIVHDLHHSYKLIERNFRQLRMPFLWALVVNLSAIFSIYAVYGAFGELVNLGAIILAYSVANFAGLVSVLPGGIGIYEALMTGVLAAAGIPAALSLPVTVMFRVLSTVIQVPPGYWLYHQTVRRAGLKPEELPTPKR